MEEGHDGVLDLNKAAEALQARGTAHLHVQTMLAESSDIAILCLKLLPRWPESCVPSISSEIALHLPSLAVAGPRS